MSSYYKYGTNHDVEEGRALVRRSHNTKTPAYAGKSLTRPLRSSATMASGGSMGYASATTAAAVATETLSSFTAGAIIIAALISLTLVLVLKVGKGISDNGSAINDLITIYHNITVPATYCLTPNNADPTYLASFIF